MELCITAADLRAALADIEAAERNGFHHCLAVLKLSSAGGGLDECRVRYSDLLERAHPTDGRLNWGRFQRVTARHRFEGGKLVPIPAGVAAVAPALPLHQAAQWNMAVQCAEREPHKQVVLEGRTVLAVHAKLTRGVSASDHPVKSNQTPMGSSPSVVSDAHSSATPNPTQPCDSGPSETSST